MIKKKPEKKERKIIKLQIVKQKTSCLKTNHAGKPALLQYLLGVLLEFRKKGVNISKPPPDWEDGEGVKYTPPLI